MRKYLTSLREFYKFSRQGSMRLIRTGDVVIVHEDNKPRLQWRFAVVENLIQGNDSHNDTTAEVAANPSQQKTDTPHVCEVRAAAARTLQKIKQWSNLLGLALENIENN